MLIIWTFLHNIQENLMWIRKKITKITRYHPKKSLVKRELVFSFSQILILYKFKKKNNYGLWSLVVAISTSHNLRRFITKRIFSTSWLAKYVGPNSKGVKEIWPCDLSIGKVLKHGKVLNNWNCDLSISKVLSNGNSTNCAIPWH